MLALAILTYKVPLPDVIANTDDHRAYLATLHARGSLLASGPFVPRVGGALLLRAADEAAIRALVADDPFYQRGIADYEIKVWGVTLGLSLFDPSAAEQASVKAK